MEIAVLRKDCASSKCIWHAAYLPTLCSKDEMMPTSIPIKFTCFLVVILSLFTATMQANAGVRINMADDLVPGRHFLVTVTIYNRGFDGYFTEQLDNSFLTSGESKDTTVLAVIPFLYDRVSASAVHPCYYGDRTRSNKAPFALRTVTLPTLRPLSWRYILDRGGPIKEGVTGITPNIINGHFYMILQSYLPAFDRAGIQEDLCQYLPLLNDMAAFAHSEQAYENRMANMNRTLRDTSEKYIESVKKIMKRSRMELDQRLDEIKAWLALEQSKRARVHDWMAHFHKADYVYREMMNNSDHKRTQQWLEEKSLNRAKERKIQWTNPETGLHYTLYPKTRHGGKSGSGYSTVLTVDLNPFLGLENNQRYMKKSYPYFYRKAEGMWKLK